jgi:muramoyltetrapeptide carboxypeptidase
MRRVKIDMKSYIKDGVKEIVLPPRLRRGDRIGIAAPASPFGSETFNQGIDILKQLGFETVVPQGVFEKENYLAGSDRHRAEQLDALFSDETIKAIICARGGYGTLRILSELDFDAVRANPKILVGFSDISTLLSAVFQQCGLVSFHGPMVTTLAGAEEATRQGLLSAISSDSPLTIAARAPVVLQRGSGTGPVAGGNLTTLCHLVGTPFQPVWKGHILFLEDINEDLYRIDRMLTQLKLAGCLEGLTGLVLGAFKDCGDMDAIYRLVMDLFDPDGPPIIGGFDIGHGLANNVTLPIGLVATLDTERGVLEYHSSATRE